jgi:hypothetical protein
VTARARVNLTLRGFSRQRAVPVEEVERVIRRLPDGHLEGLREIIYCAGEPLHYPSLGAASAASGLAEYVQSARTIFVYSTEDPALFRHVLRHEIGHHVFFLRVESALKKEWATWLYPGSECATPYGYASLAEDFAECYALYAREPALLADFPEKLAFMREVFSGRPGALREDRSPTR